MKTFIWFRRNRATVNGILITIFTSLVFNTISETKGNIFKEYKRIATQLFQFGTLSGFLTIVSLVALVLFNVTFIIMKHCLNKNALSREFPALMKKYTSPQLVNSIGNGCLSWGEGKTVEICNDIIFGWNPKNIVIEDYENELYKFYAEEERTRKFGEKSYYFNNKDYMKYIKSKTFKEVERKGNNLPRFMLRGCSKNYDKNNRKLLLSLGRTEWSQTSYVWDRFGKSKGCEVASNDLMKEYSKGIKSGEASDPYLPNSLCMHLLIESLDNKVILSRISESKRNDNPGTWAATLGEQLDLDDFTDGNNFYDNFVVKWMRRAFQEEYKFDKKMYADIVDESSLKCLSVDFESDRYNFALFCTVQLRYTFDTFYEKAKVLLSTEESCKLRAVSLDEIPQILMTYTDEEKRKEYHPSSYLRLLMFFVHKYGYSRAERILLKYDRENRT